MRFKAVKNVLCDLFMNASKAAASHATNPALGGILLTLKGNILTATGYDLEMGIKTTTTVDGFKDGEIVLNAKLLGDLIRKMPSSGVVEFIVENETTVFLISGNVEFKLVGISGNEYPNIPEINKTTSFNVPEGILRSMIAQTFHALSKTDYKPVHKGSLFRLHENVLEVVSIDGIRMAERIEPIESSDIRFVVPGRTLEELIRILKEDENEKNVTICLDKNQVCFFKDDYMIISRILDGDFIDYEKIMTFNETCSAVMAITPFIDSLERTLLLTSDRFSSPVVCSFEKDCCKISCKSNIGEVSDSIEIEYKGEPLTIAFKAKLMVDALKNSDCDKVKLVMKSDIAPIKILPIEGNSFVFLVLPVRLK